MNRERKTLDTSCWKMTFWICDVTAKAVTQTHTSLCPNRSIMSPVPVRERGDGLKEGWREGDRQIQRETIASSLTDVKLLLAPH